MRLHLQLPLGLSALDHPAQVLLLVVSVAEVQLFDEQFARVPLLWHLGRFPLNTPVEGASCGRLMDPHWEGDAGTLTKLVPTVVLHEDHQHVLNEHAFAAVRDTKAVRKFVRRIEIRNNVLGKLDLKHLLKLALGSEAFLLYLRDVATVLGDLLLDEVNALETPVHFEFERFYRLVALLVVASDLYLSLGAGRKLILVNLDHRLA